MESLLAWQWRQPELLWLLWLPVIWWGLAFGWRRHLNHHYAQSHLLPWVQVSNFDVKSTLKMTRPGYYLRLLGQPKSLLLLAWMGLVIGSAGPRTLVPSPEQTQRAGVDVLVAIDTSRSMMAQDVAPNRFLYAKALIESLVNRLEINDRVGLMVYAGQPHLVAPLSYDRNLFQYYLNLVRPGILPTMGSQTELAIDFGLSHLQQTAGKTQLLLLFSDGGIISTSGQNSSKVVKSYPGQLRVIGVGQSQPSVIPDQTHRTGTLYLNGKQVTTQLDAASLQKLATEWHGSYMQASNSLAFLQNFLNDLSAQAEARTEQSSQPVWEDHAKGFIAVAFFALLWAFYPVRLARNAGSGRSSLSLLSLTLSVSFLAAITSSDAVWAQWLSESPVEQEQQAYQSFQLKQYDQAEQAYQQLDHFNGILGAGASAYRKQDYESAVPYFQQAALQAETSQKRAYALLNLGNSYYQSGLFSHAIEAYQQALLYQPGYEKAKHNLALAQKARQRQSGQQQNEESGEGQGSGESSRDNEGAFYGGQRPDPSSGEGASGDAPEGNKDGREFVLPETQDPTDFSLNPAQPFALNTTANAILDQQQRRQRVEQFEKNMRGIQDNQMALLKHLFEREEGFQAQQTQRHPIPGIQPW